MSRQISLDCCNTLIAHVSGSQYVGRVISDCVFLWSVCCVHNLKGKRLELLTPNLVDIQCTAVARHAITEIKVKVIKCLAIIGMHVGMSA